MVDKYRLTSLIPVKVQRNVQLANASAAVKKLDDAGQPCHTPRSKSNSGPILDSHVSFCVEIKAHLTPQMKKGIDRGIIQRRFGLKRRMPPLIRY